MPINADKPYLWKADTRASVDQFNQWFMKFAPRAYRDTRKKTIESVEKGLTLTKDLTVISPDVIKANPGILPTLRMSTCPPLARDRLIGLSDSTKNFVGCLEEGNLPRLLSPELLEEHLGRITGSSIGASRAIAASGRRLAGPSSGSSMSATLSQTVSTDSSSTGSSGRTSPFHSKVAGSASTGVTSARLPISHMAAPHRPAQADRYRRAA